MKKRKDYKTEKVKCDKGCIKQVAGKNWEYVLFFPFVVLNIKLERKPEA